MNWIGLEVLYTSESKNLTCITFKLIYISGFRRGLGLILYNLVPELAESRSDKEESGRSLI